MSIMSIEETKTALPTPKPFAARATKRARAKKVATKRVSKEAKAAAREYAQVTGSKSVKKRTAKKGAPKRAAPKRAAPKRAAKAAKAAKKRSATSKTAKAPAISNKSKFVRDNPKLSAKELVAKAKTLGTKLRVNYVYNIRGALKTKLKHKFAVSGNYGRGPGKAALEAEGARGDRGPMTLEELFLMVVAELGTPRAVALLGSLRSVVQSALTRGA